MSCGPALLRPLGRRPRARGHLTSELLLLGIAWTAYSAVRLLAGDDVARAQQNGRAILALESRLGMDVEPALNAAVHAIPAVAVATSYWYAALHYTVTAGVLAWLFHRDRNTYRRQRTVLCAASALGLAGFVLLPTAPPRLLPGSGVTDTLAATAPYGWWGGAASAPEGLGALTNQLAAMPSLHAGWALWVALAVTAAGASPPARLLATGYAVITAVVVIATANHYVLDVATGWGVVVLAAGWAARGPVVPPTPRTVRRRRLGTRPSQS